MLETKILQSLLACGADEISMQHFVMANAVQQRTQHSRKGNKGLAEDFNKDVEKARKRIKILSRNQAALKQAIKYMAFSDAVDYMLYADYDISE